MTILYCVTIQNKRVDFLKTLQLNFTCSENHCFCLSRNNMPIDDKMISNNDNLVSHASFFVQIGFIVYYKIYSKLQCLFYEQNNIQLLRTNRICRKMQCLFYEQTWSGEPSIYITRPKLYRFGFIHNRSAKGRQWIDNR